MRAMSVRENAKSKTHRKTHQVEPGGTGRMCMHLTRGDLPRERAGEVSRGRSSEEARRKAGGAKGRRTSRGQLANGVRGRRRGALRNRAGPTTTVSSRTGEEVESRWRPAGGRIAEGKSKPVRKEGQEDA
jgi:hypothetical protein